MNKIINLLIMSSLLIMYSCDTGYVNMAIEADGGYPVITIANRGGADIVISPVDRQTGSIGYVQNEKVVWIKGEPVFSRTDDSTHIIRWVSDTGGEIRMIITQQKEDFSVSLNLKDTTDNEVSSWIVYLRAASDEFFTGVFERVVDGHQNNSWADSIKEALDLRGQRVEVKLKPTVSAYAPFYISSSNYGFFAEGSWPGVIDFCRENKDFVKISFEGSEFNFRIYSDDNPLDIVRRHALETGPSVVPPLWSFGPWRWRDDHSNNEAYYDGTIKSAPFNTDLVEDILMMQALDVPCTAYWIDRPWAIGPNGFDDYEFDPVRFPEPERMIHWLNGKNIELMMWIAPFVMGDMAVYAEDNSYSLVSKIHGNTPGQVLIDFTNPDAVKWWGENGPGKLAKMGIKGFKLDRADGEKLTDSVHLTTSSGRSYRENYNDFPRQYVEATYNAVTPVLGSDFILFPRAQYTGSARYGGMWAGDTDGKAEGLRSVIIGMQRCSVMGYPLWGSDIGGYWGSYSRETTMRWLAFGCFSPLMEVGPTNNLAFWSSPGEPAYDTLLIATWRLYAKTRMKIQGYIAGLAQKAHDDGTPVVLPLFLLYPEQKEAWNDWQTYMLGPDILVSAVWQNNQTEKEVYLPEGEIWTDAWTGEDFAGGEYVTVKTPLYKIPIFIREGSVIDPGNLMELYEESLMVASSRPDMKLLESNENWH